MKKITRAFLAGVALVLLGVPAGALVKEQTDREGRVVLRADGERINQRPMTFEPRRPLVRTHASGAPSGPLDVRDDWRFAPGGWGIGVPGLEIADLDADGDSEM